MSDFSTSAGRVHRPGQALPSGGAHAEAASKPSIFILLFVLALVQPYFLTLGGVVMGPARAFLLVATVPVMIAYLSGRAGKIIVADFLVILYVLWMAMAVLVNYGAALPFNFLVAQMLETATPYFLARILIRDLASLQFFVRSMLWVILLLIPIAVMESVLDINFLNKLADAVPGLNIFHQVQHEQRLGLYRAQGPFEHPILFGLFCSVPFALAWMALYPKGTHMAVRAFWSGVCVMGTFFSLSVGTYLSLIAQGGLLAWETVLRTMQARWKLFAVLAVLGYIALDIVIESNPILYLAANATMNAGSAWNRVLIWQHTNDDLMRNPIFGIAYKDWTRPGWMLESIDNYWLVVALRYGIPAFALHISTIIATVWALVRIDFTGRPMLAQVRMGYLITLCGLSVTLATVHIWSATYILFMFLVGAGAWLVTAAEGQAETPAETTAGRTRARPGRTTATAAGRVAEAEDTGPEAERGPERGSSERQTGRAPPRRGGAGPGRQPRRGQPRYTRFGGPGDDA